MGDEGVGRKTILKCVLKKKVVKIRLRLSRMIRNDWRVLVNEKMNLQVP
jgi:hypothetical protein